MKSKEPKIAFFMLSFLLSLSIQLLAQPTLQFSHERGFYDRGFELTISANHEDSRIHYTFDGSDPRFSEYAQIAGNSVDFVVQPYCNEGRAITPGFIVRACAITDQDTGRVETHSYIFLAEVKYQSDISPDLAPYWPVTRTVPNTYPENLLDWMKSDLQEIYLGVDPEVVHKPEYFDGFEATLKDIPIFSLVTDPENLFRDSTGIYINAVWSGREWEKPGSLELIAENEDGFQVNAGIRIRGGFSCRGDFAKHAFRIFFREEYGDAKLKYPLFPGYGTEEFDKIDLRSSQNNSWHIGNPGADFIRDVCARQIQGDMGEPYSRSEYYHLFVNGKYWGLFQTQERTEARFAESYLGGDKEEYDVVKSSGPSYDYPSYTLEATDGDLNSSYDFWRIAKEGFTTENYLKVQGKNQDGSSNPDYPVYLDVENLIDYILITYFIANTDGPAALSSTDFRINNFFGIYDRSNPDGFKYFIHDAEHGFNTIAADITQISVLAGEDSTGFNPMWLHQRLMENEDYMQVFADRAQMHLFYGGALSSASCISRYDWLSSKIEYAIIGESARWGYIRAFRPYTKNETWLPVVDWFMERYFPQRTDVVIGQFRDNGWLSDLKAPEMDASEYIEEGDRDLLLVGSTFTLTNPNESGAIYYCLDGTDPRGIEGEPAPHALLYSEAIEAGSTCFLSARVKDGDSWSTPTKMLLLSQTGEGILFSEINYDIPKQIIAEDTLSAKSLEFIELKNYTGSDQDLSGITLSGGVSYTFPYGSAVQTDSLVVIAADTAAFKKFYGFSAFGPFEGSLSNQGEVLLLKNAGDRTLSILEYNQGDTWYKAADGAGYTLVYRDYAVFQFGSNKDNWRPSASLYGSPGKDDPEIEADSISITEVLANSEFPYRDAIEIQNEGSLDADISYWFLTDEKDKPGKWQIPVGTVLAAGEYVVFYEGHYVTDTLQYEADEFGSSFSISSAGEDVYLNAGDSEGNVGHAIADLEVPATLENTSIGNYTTVSGIKHQVQLEEQYLGTANILARKSPVVITEIMYNPIADNYEYLILKNRTDSVVNLFHDSDSLISWELDGIGFSFPKGISIEAGDSLYLVEKLIKAEEFAAIMSLDPAVQVFNYPGKMKNGGEELCLQCPVEIIGDTSTTYVMADLECVDYDDSSPWPSLADGDGWALAREDEEEFANDPDAWSAIYKVFPDADAGRNERVRIDRAINLNGTRSIDPGGMSLSYQWELLDAPEGSVASLPEHTSVSPEYTPDQEGEYLFSLKVNNGRYSSSASYVTLFAHMNHAPVAGTYPTLYKPIEGEEVIVTASGCYDPDYDELNYEWDLIEVPETSSQTLDLYTGRSFDFTPDVNGTFEFELSVNDGELYSDQVVVRVRASTNAIFNHESLTDRVAIYPNPVTTDLNLEFIMAEGADVQVTLFDLHGKVLAVEHFADMKPGYQQLSIDMESLGISEGVYLICIETEEFREMEKVIYIP